MNTDFTHYFNFLQKNAKYAIYAVSILWFFSACQQNPYEIDVSPIEIETHFQRFDQAFFSLDSAELPQELPRLQRQFPPFFRQQQSPAFWQKQHSDALQRELYRKVQKKYANMERYQVELNAAMQHYYHYFGTDDTIAFYTYISNLDYDYPVLYAQNYCFVALDMYLGKDATYYEGRPRYLNFKRQPQFLIRDCIEALLEPQLNHKAKQGTLLQNMIYYGKILHAMQRLMPQHPPHQLIQYTERDWQFCLEKEKTIWSYFVENQLLFNATENVKRNFIREAPFSKFRTRNDRETPGRIGRWIGWQIVEAYAQSSGELRPLQEILAEEDARKILKLSGYKPWAFVD